MEDTNLVFIEGSKDLIYDLFMVVTLFSLLWGPSFRSHFERLVTMLNSDKTS